MFSSYAYVLGGEISQSHLRLRKTAEDVLMSTKFQDVLIWLLHKHQLNRAQLLRVSRSMWGFPEIGVPQNGWFIKEHPIKMDDLGVLLFLETSMSTQLSTVKACQTDLFVSSCYLQKRKIHGTHDASMGRRVYVPIHENHTNQLDSWIGKYTVRRMDASWMGVSSQQQRLAGETPPLCWGTSNEGCQAGRKICHAENQQHVIIQVVGQEGYLRYYIHAMSPQNPWKHERFWPPKNQVIYHQKPLKL